MNFSFCLSLMIVVLMSQSAGGLAAAAQEPLRMMPLPQRAVAGRGAFALDGGFDVVLTGYTEPRLDRARERFFETLKNETGILRWPATESPRQKIEIHTGGPSAAVQQVGEDESYRLQVTADGIVVTAPNPLGAMHGLQTLLQLVHAGPQGYVVDAVRIEDAPRFAWRGLMLDSGRHFTPLPIVRRTLDAMEAVKLNVLHWHVSEDQGFRMESKLYPGLQGKGSDGMFYSQEEVRGIIAYARDRGIRVMPEFEMPSHATSLFVGYPELADGTGPYRLKRRFGEKWGRPRKTAEDSSMDPTRESTYIFLDRFLGEMGELFPDAYMHLGGDAEDAITEWATNAHIQRYIQEHGLKDGRGLQAYFTSRLQRILKSHSKVMVGWDEVLQPDTPAEVTIHSWRGLDSMAAALKSGHHAILSWGYYLDLNEPASRHFAVDPLAGPVAALPVELQKNILGGETPMWTEYVSPETIEGRIWPRAAAVAERLWSPASDVQMESMYSRLGEFAQHLAYVGVPFAERRAMLLNRLAGSADAAPLRVLASVVEPPQGFPREGTREYDVYTPLNHLADIIAAESDAAREFRQVCARISAGAASEQDVRNARRTLTLWRDNDEALGPTLTSSVLLQELVPVSRALKEVAAMGLEALGTPGEAMPMSESLRREKLERLKTLALPEAELRIAIIPGVQELIARK